MSTRKGDYFRTVRFGGFHREDVMQYIEALEQRYQAQGHALEEQTRRLKEARSGLLRWMGAARLERRRGLAARQVQRELDAFQRQLQAAQTLAQEIEDENRFLRKRIRVLEDEPRVEPPSVPLEQLTFELFLEGLED
ncbi:MAG: hypothetical protein LBG83_08010 [Oscillospiraceae bacterium]|jgi:hypothetical protein|nr:hypothetical protein [Oscillospiraceae bacterium]